ncbi:MAG: hypothetical protein RLZZ459_911, partial [Cyanobacteriota bacterium]
LNHALLPGKIRTASISLVGAVDSPGKPEPVATLARVAPTAEPSTMNLPPVSMDLGLLLISIGVVNLWRARQAS